MATKITNYQCPACTGPLRFDEKTGKLVCDYCGSSYTTQQIEEYYAKKNEQAAEAAEDASGDAWDTSGLSDDWGADGRKIKIYNCPSCGAQLICDETTGATSCPYCGNPAIIPGQFAGGLRPDYVMPFKLTHDDAVQALKNFYKGKILLPGAFTNENHIREIRGVYVPFWLFDGKAEGRMDYEATKVRSYMSGDYEITETDHFDVTREGSIDFDKIPVDASTRMPDEYMDALEPFPYEKLEPFSMSYFPGFLADKYDVSADESAKRADTRCEGSFRAECENTVVGYATTRKTGEHIRIRRGKVYYGLLPVWVLNTKWRDKTFLFIVNGQTGKVAGELPSSRGKIFGLYAAIAAPLIAIGTAMSFWLVR